MAGNRDVKLTIRAKDETSKVLDALKNKLSDFEKGTDSLSKAVTPLGGKFKILSDSVAQLQTQLGKAQAQAQVNEQYRNTAQAIDAIADASKLAKTAIADNTAELAKAQTTLAEYNTKREKLKATLAEEASELSKANTALDRNTKKLADAKVKSEQLTVDLEKRQKASAEYTATLTTQVAKQEALERQIEQETEAIKAQSAALAQLKLDRIEANKPLSGRSGLNAKLTRAEARFEKDPNIVNEQAIAALKAQIAPIKAQLAQMDAGIAAGGEGIDGRKSGLAVMRGQLKAIKAEAAETRTALSGLGDLDKLGNRQAKAAKNVAEYSAAIEKAKTTITQLTPTVASAESELRDLNLNFQDSYNTVQKLEGELKKLDRELKNTETAADLAAKNLQEIEESARAGGLDRLTADAAKLNKEIDELQAGLAIKSRALGSAAKYEGGDGLARNAKDAAAHRQLSQAMREAEADAEAMKAQIVALNQAIERGDGGRKDMAQDIKRLEAALRSATKQADGYRQEMRQIDVNSGRMKASLGDMWRKHNNESRTALNLYQRLRGQVLAMVSAYVGFYGVINIVQQVSEAFMKQEAILSRLGVVFGGNADRMAVEMGWLRREANRLGIEMGVLAGEYTKFAVGATQSGFTLDSTRKIFTSVSEAARVNKLSVEDVGGVYLALSQMIGKGRISSEELRQQMGERLPGAFSLFADALGVSMGELTKMLELGQVAADEDTMLKFANKLDEVFGGQLPASLKTFTAEWGRLQNTIYQSKVLIGEGGLISALTDGMRRINEYASSQEGQQFFLKIGHGMGEIAKWLPTLLENFDLLVFAVKMLAVVGLASVFMRWYAAAGSLIGGLKTSAVTIWGVIRGMDGLTAASMRSAGAMTTARGAAIGLRTSLLALGPLLAGLAVVSTIITSVVNWGSGVDDLTSAQTEHERVMDRILAQYEEGKKKTGDWKQSVDEITQRQAGQNFNTMFEQYENAVTRMENLSKGFVADANIFARLDPSQQNVGAYNLANAGQYASTMGFDPKIAEAAQKSWSKVTGDLRKATRADIEEAIKAMQALENAIPHPRMKASIGGLVDELTRFKGVGNSLAESAVGANEMGHSVGLLESILSRFPTSLKEMSEGTEDAAAKAAAAEKRFKEWEEALKGLSNMVIPKTKEELKKLEDQAKIEGFAKAGLNAAKGWQQAWEVLKGTYAAFVDLERKSMNADFYSNAFMGAAYSGDPNAKLPNTPLSNSEAQTLVTEVSKIAKDLGVSARDILAVISKESGFRPNVMGGAGGQYRGFIQFSPENAKRYGINDNTTLVEQVRAIGQYMKDRGVRPGHNGANVYASVLAGQAHLVNAGDIKNGGNVRNVTESVTGSDFAPHYAKADGLLNTYGPGANAAMTASEAETARKKALDQQAEQLRLQGLINNGQEREAFIQQEIAAFKAQHGNLTDQELAKMRENLGLLYDARNVKKLDKDEKEQEKKLQEDINRLETHRNALLEKRKHYEEKGDAENLAIVNGELVEINSQLDAAIQKMIDFWNASGSAEASSAIAALEATRLGIQETGKEALISAQQINEQFAEGLSSSFTSLAEALANGQSGIKGFRDAFLKFAADFLIQMGQMIIKQTMLNALQGAGGAGSGGVGGMVLGGLRSITSGIFHTGKAANAASQATRSISPMAFVGAPRFHQGKMPGLRPGEMTAIIEHDEEVIPRSDPRHSANAGRGGAGAGAGGGSGDTLVANFFDVESFLESGLGTANGRKVFMNFINANGRAIKQAMES